MIGKMLIILLIICANGASASLYEDYNNVEKMDTREKYLLDNTSVTYEFISVPPVYNVSVTGRANEFDVQLKIEILKNVSESVRQPAGRAIYKYFNAWIRTGRIENVTIGYVVNNSWMNDNNMSEENIRLVEWNGLWKVLDTKIIDSRNDGTHFESKTDAIGHPSYFAIIGNDEENVETITLSGNISEREIAEDEEEVVQNEEDEDEEEIVIEVDEEEPQQSTGFGLITVILVFVSLYLKRKY